jgi:hypothetical protein
MKRTYKIELTGPFMLMLAVLVGCGGGSSGTPTSGGSLSISGVAATGAAISGGTVEAKCQSGTGTATSGADGSYTVTIAGGAQPCLLKATDPVTKVELFSLAESGSTSANITPVTSLVVANVVGDSPETAFTNFSTNTRSKITSTNVSTAVSRVQAATAALGSDADMTGVDFMKGTMRAATESAAGDATDKKIDALMAALAAADKKISDLTNTLKAVTSSGDAAAGLTSLVGNAKYSLGSCPYARSGDFWVINFAGAAPVSYNADFNTMVLKKNSDNTTSVIDFKRDSSNAVVPCAFTSIVGGQNVEYRVSEGGVGVWKQSNDFGIFVPVQKSRQLNDISLIGSHASIAFIREKTSGFRAAAPIRFEVDDKGGIKSYQCDMTKTKPDCLLADNDSNADNVTCSAQSNGTFSCTSTAGLAATAVVFISGSQATMFMSITNMNFGAYSFGGLMIMTKAAKIALPKVGEKTLADAAWFAGVDSGSNIVSSGGTSESTVESVDVANNAYVTSSGGTTTLFTRYIDTPAKGFLFSKSALAQGVTVRSPSGWAVAMHKGINGEFDGWAAYVRGRR